MKKVRFLKDVYTFDKNSYRTILKEDNECYYIQEKLHSLDTIKFYKNYIV